MLVSFTLPILLADAGWSLIYLLIDDGLFGAVMIFAVLKRWVVRGSSPGAGHYRSRGSMVSYALFGEPE